MKYVSFSAMVVNPLHHSRNWSPLMRLPEYSPAQPVAARADPLARDTYGPHGREHDE
jgi:hypothetical protein